ncbi:MAG: recombinase RecA [Candidatus Berkelbacteria bacterium]
MAKQVEEKKNVSRKEGEESAKQEALEMAFSQIERQFGSGAIMRFGDKERLKIDAISSGSISLDLALGIGGFPRGRIVEIYGPESSGKTTLALHLIAEAQKKGGIGAFIDAEHAFDPEYAANIGININELLISQPDTGEQALEICETLVRSNAIDVIVVDSVAALVPRSEIEGDMGDASMGVQARLMSQALRKLTGAISKSKTIVVFINQIRMKIGVMFGNPETTAGGMALKFYSSVRLDIRRTEQLKNGEEIIGNHTKVKIVKNKVAPPFRIAEFDIMYGEGIAKEGDILDLGAKMGIVNKAGSWYQYNDEKIGQGREQAKEFLKDNKKITREIEEKIRAKVADEAEVKKDAKDAREAKDKSDEAAEVKE